MKTFKQFLKESEEKELDEAISKNVIGQYEEEMNTGWFKYNDGLQGFIDHIKYNTSYDTKMIENIIHKIQNNMYNSYNQIYKQLNILAKKALEKQK